MRSGSRTISNHRLGRFPQVTQTTCAFVKQNPQIVFADGVPKEQGPWTTPRSTVLADR